MLHLTPSILFNQRPTKTDLITATKGLTTLKGHDNHSFPSFSIFKKFMLIKEKWELKKN